MSNTIDEKVVEMRFDNKNFEQNVKTSLTTLEKLKQSLKLDGASKGLENVQAAAKKVNFSGMIEGIDTVNARFSYLQASVQHQLNRIVDSAVNAGRNVVNAFTFEPVKSGFQEYETQINAVQTILANTSHNGTTLNEVNAALDELNTYADKTIYNFTEMTNNIGKFTAAGVDLQTSVDSIKGIANLAAVSGSTSQQASTAMYQLSQALAAGKVSLMDWNSVVNAGMGGKVFQDALIRTSELLGTGAQEAVKFYGSFRESLTKGEWLTTEVLTETLKQISGAYSEADLIAQGFTEDQAKEISKLADTAVNAATKVKTFTQLMDTLKEAAQSGWTQTWELIIGDFEESKEFYTKISDTLGEIIGKSSEARNELLGGALNNNWEKLIDTLGEMGISAGDFEKKMSIVLEENGADIEELTKEYGSLGKAIEREFRSGAISSDILKTAVQELTGLLPGLDNITEELKFGDVSDDVKTVQSALEELGYDLGKSGIDGKIDAETEAAIKAFQEANNLEVTGIVDEKTLQMVKQLTDELYDLSDVKKDLAIGETGEDVKKVQKTLKVLGYDLNKFGVDGKFGEETEAALKAFQEVAGLEVTGIVDEATLQALQEANESTKSLNEELFGLIDEIDELGGREKLIKAFGNVWTNLVNIFSKIKEAYRSVFPPATSEQIVGLIDAFQAFTENMIMSEENLEKIKNTFQGLFAILKIVTTIVGGGLRIGFYVASKILGAFGLTLLDVTSVIGKLAYNFEQFLETGGFIREFFDNLISMLPFAVDSFKNWVDQFIKSHPRLSAFIINIKEIIHCFKLLSGAEVGSDYFFSLLESISSLSKNTGRLVSGMFKKILGSLKGFSKISDVAKNIKDIFKIFKSLTKLKIGSEEFKNMAKFLPRIFEQLKSNLAVVFKDIWKTIKDGIDNAFGEGSSDILNSIVKFIPFPLLTSILGTKLLSSVLGVKPILLRGMLFIGSCLLQGLKIGFGDEIGNVLSAVAQVAKDVIAKFCEIFGINSPAKSTIELAMWLMKGFVVGIIEGIKIVTIAITTAGKFIIEGFSFIVDKVVTFAKSVDWPGLFEKILPYVPVVAALYLVKKIWDFVRALTGAVDGIASVVENFALIEEQFANVLKSYAFDTRMEGLKKFAEAVAILVGCVVVLTLVDQEKMYNALGAVIVLAAVLAALAFAMQKLEETNIKFGKGVEIKGIRTGLIAIGASLLLIAVVAKIVSGIKVPDLIKSFIFLTAVLIEMGAFMLALSWLSSKANINLKRIENIGSMMLKLSWAMILTAIALKVIGTMNGGELAKGIIFIAVFGVFVYAIAKVAQGSEKSMKHISKLGSMVLKLAIAMALMIIVIKMVKLLNAGDVFRGILFAGAFVLFVKALVSVTKVGKKQKIASLGGLLLSISISMLLMVGICKLAGMLSKEEMIKGGLFALAFIGFVKLLIKATTIGSQQKLAQVSLTLIAMVFAIGILAVVATLLGMVPNEQLAKGVAAVGILGLVLAAIVKAAQGVGKCISSILAMAVAVGVIAAVMAALTLLPMDKVKNAGQSLALVMATFALMIKAMNGFKMDKSALGGLAALSVVVIILAVILGVMAHLKVEGSINTAVAIGVLLVAMASSLAILGQVKRISNDVYAPLFIMSGVVFILAVILGAMSALNVEASIPTAIALSILLLALASSIAILGTIGVNAFALDSAVMAMGKLALVIGGVALVFGVIGGLLAMIPGAQEFFDKAIPLLKSIGLGLGEFIGGIIGGITSGMTSALPEIGDDISDFVNAFSGVDPAVVGTIKSIVGALTAIAGANFINKISKWVGLGDPIKNFKNDLIKLADALGAFSAKLEKTPINYDAIDTAAKAGEAMAKLQDSISPIIGVAQVLTGVRSLGAFGTDIKIYANMLKQATQALSNEDGSIAINKDRIQAAADAGMAMATLQDAIEPVSLLAKAISGYRDLGTFGEDINAYADSLKEASKALSNENGGIAINKDSIEKAAEAGMAMAELQDAIEPVSTLARILSGYKNLGTFGEDIKKYGKALRAASKALTDEDGNAVVNETAINTAKKAGDMLVELQESIPEEHWLDGKVSLEDFGKKIKSFGESMSDFGDSVSDIDSTSIGTAIGFAYRIKKLITSLVDLDTTGITAFTGVGTGGVGADGAAYKIAEVMAKFSKKVSDIDTNAVTVSVSAAKKLKSLISSLVNLDTSGVELFEPYKIGNAMKKYADKVSGIDAKTVSESISSANRLKKLIASLADLDTSGIDKFRLTSIGNALKTYSSSVSGMDLIKVVSSITAANRLKSFISSLSDIDTSGVTSFKNAVSSLGKINLGDAVGSLSKSASKFSSIGSNMISSLTRGITSKTSTTKSVISNTLSSMLNTIKSKLPEFNAAGVQLMTRLADGLLSQKSKVTIAVQIAISSASGAVRSNYMSMYYAGTYLGSGLVSGINSKKNSVYWAGYALGQMAVRGEKDGQRSNSPSKLTIQAGKWLGEGLVIGINNMTSSVYKAGHVLGESAVGTISSTIAKVSDYVNSGLEVDPTIRPIMDLSGIESGIGAIDGMFDKTMSLGTISNLGAINRIRSQRNQNGVNDDVVSAINKLGKNLQNVGNTVNNINGITYDDGSNISQAVEMLVNAAKMGRRT